MDPLLIPSYCMTAISYYVIIMNCYGLCMHTYLTTCLKCTAVEAWMFYYMYLSLITSKPICCCQSQACALCSCITAAKNGKSDKT